MLSFHEWTYNNISSVPRQPGIYLLFTSQPILNSYGTDPKGILYIGETKNLWRRLHCSSKPDWKGCYEKKSDKMFNHSALTYAVDFDKNCRLILHRNLIGDGYLKDVHEIYLKYAISKNHKNDQVNFLNGHVIRYGQTPLFNSTGSSLKAIWEAEDSDWRDADNFYKGVIKTI